MAFPKLRLAESSDLFAINEIYNHYVYHSTCTYQTEPDTMKDRAEWFEHHGSNYPITVIEDENGILGWGSISKFRERFGYRFTVEDSVYLHPEARGKKLGSRLLVDLIERAKLLRYRTMIAGISAEQESSVALHKKYGFTIVAHLHEVGYKFGKWLDLIYMELSL